MQEAGPARPKPCWGPIAHAVHAAALGSGKFGLSIYPSHAPAIGPPRAGGECNGNGFMRRNAITPGMVSRPKGGTLVFSRLRRRTNRFPDRSALQAQARRPNINFAQCLGKGSRPTRNPASTWSVRGYGCVRRLKRTHLEKAWNDQQAAGPATVRTKSGRTEKGASR